MSEYDWATQPMIIVTDEIDLATRVTVPDGSEKTFADLTASDCLAIAAASSEPFNIEFYTELATAIFDYGTLGAAFRAGAFG